MENRELAKIVYLAAQGGGLPSIRVAFVADARSIEETEALKQTLLEIEELVGPFPKILEVSLLGSAFHGMREMDIDDPPPQWIKLVHV